MNRIKENAKEIFIEMPVGTGKSITLKKLAMLLKTNSNILILVNTKSLEEQQSRFLEHMENVTISNYNNINNNKDFNYVILDNAEVLSEEKYIFNVN